MGDRWQIVDLPIDRFLFPSPQVPTALYLFAMACAIRAGRAGWRWVLVGGVVLGLFLITGTRASLLMSWDPWQWL